MNAANLHETTNGIEDKSLLFKNRKFVPNTLVEELEKKIYTKNGVDKQELLKINKLIENAIHWCLVNGFVLVPKSRKLDDLMVVTYLPFTLFPTPFKRSHYSQVMDLQPHINDLVYRISKSTEFMEKSFETLKESDKFLNSLWDVHLKSLAEGYNQKIKLIINRTDYMLHQSNMSSDQISIKQVEINTISAGFGYVSTKATKLHREILNWTNNFDYLKNVPINEPVVKMAKGFAEAWRLYKVSNSIVLFIVLDVETNIADQRHLEYEIINQEPGIEIQRCTLCELNQYGRVDQNKTLYFHNREVSIVYYRAGYDPSHYKSNKEWDALIMIEISKAIKCPEVGQFLAGMKKIQETISDEKNLAPLCNNDSTIVDSFKAVFANFFLLNNQKNVDQVLKNPENYVLKPQREGGGHNFYDKQIIELLNKIQSNEKKLVNGHDSNHSLTEKCDNNIYNKELYIVMEYLRPAISDNFIISPKSQQNLYQSGKEGTLNKISITNELGIYGVLVKNGDETVLNEACGYCLRSKPAEDNEAGVMCGSGALDSIYFVE